MASGKGDIKVTAWCQSCQSRQV